MKNPLSFLPVLFLLIAAPALPAADDTAHHREVYQKINAAAKTLTVRKAVYEDQPIVFELEAWFDGKSLVRILSKVPGEDGGGHEEYYYENGKVLFVFRQYRGVHPVSGKPDALIEDRFYFKNGTLFKWLGTDKKVVPAGSGDFKSEAERLTKNASDFALTLAGKNPEAKPAVQLEQTTGIFRSIEQGDYAHWKMTDAKGREVSFFVLQPDKELEKVLANPKKFSGRRCRVTWKTTMEEIPEAGGKMKVDQITAVEWLGKPG